MSYARHQSISEITTGRYAALWVLVTWCFSTMPSVATVLGIMAMRDFVKPMATHWLLKSSANVAKSETGACGRVTQDRWRAHNMKSHYQAKMVRTELGHYHASSIFAHTQIPRPSVEVPLYKHQWKFNKIYITVRHRHNTVNFPNDSIRKQPHTSS